MHLGRVMGVGVVVAAALVAGCGGGNLDATKVAASVKSEFEAQTSNVLSEITCNGGAAVGVGSTIQCQGKGVNGHGYTFEVKLKDSNGAVSWSSTDLNP
ncbi:MAG: DUF4333 domain-containing protein [Chloroflexota bacterium]